MLARSGAAISALVVLAACSPAATNNTAVSPQGSPSGLTGAKWNVEVVNNTGENVEMKFVYNYTTPLDGSSGNGPHCVYGHDTDERTTLTDRSLAPGESFSGDVINSASAFACDRYKGYFGIVAKMGHKQVYTLLQTSGPSGGLVTTWDKTARPAPPPDAAASSPLTPVNITSSEKQDGSGYLVKLSPRPQPTLVSDTAKAAAILKENCGDEETAAQNCDFTNVVMTPRQEDERLYGHYVRNCAASATSDLDHTVTESETYSWSQGIGLESKQSGKIGIPLVAEGAIELTQKYDVSWSKEHNIGQSDLMKVPAHYEGGWYVSNGAIDAVGDFVVGIPKENRLVLIKDFTYEMPLTKTVETKDRVVIMPSILSAYTWECGKAGGKFETPPPGAKLIKREERTT